MFDNVPSENFPALLSVMVNRQGLGSVLAKLLKLLTDGEFSDLYEENTLNKLESNLENLVLVIQNIEKYNRE